MRCWRVISDKRFFERQDLTHPLRRRQNRAWEYLSFLCRFQ
jgi:hypothetical protein